MAKFEKFGFTVNHIQLCDMNSPSNPAGELFKLLADRNVKISLLYLALASMNLPEAMTILQCYGWYLYVLQLMQKLSGLNIVNTATNLLSSFRKFNEKCTAST